MNELEDDLTLARYFPIDRFIGESGFLSAQSLYLPKLGKQHDPLEGLATKTTVKNILSSEKAAGNPGFVGQALLGVQGTMSKNATYVSCWTRCLEAKECSAKTYGNAALMVFTTVGKLKKIMPKTAKIRAVQYVDEIDDQKSISPDIINFQKRKNYHSFSLSLRHIKKKVFQPVGRIGSHKTEGEKTGF